jgi:sarcosine oxidase/L-pipecolate oxidase
VTFINRHPIPSVDSAGYDLNKIVRTEYDEPLYTKLALEALDAWRQLEWKGIFHETVSRTAFSMALYLSEC